MSLRGSFSKFKQRFKGSGRKPSKKGTTSSGDRVDSMESGSAYSVGGIIRDPGAGGTDLVGEPVRSPSLSVQWDGPAPASADESEIGQEGVGEANVDRNVGKTQVSARLSGVEPSMGSGGGGEVEQVHPSPLPTQIPQNTRPDDLIGAGVIPDRVRTEGHPSKSAEPKIAVDGKKSNWKSTVFSTTKLLLSGVRDAGDAFGPLKSVAGALCFILENCERTMANKQAIESLAPRVKTLAGQLDEDIPVGDVKEVERRKQLWGRLERVAQELKQLGEQGNIKGFFTNATNADNLRGLIEDIRDAVMDYQTLLQQDIYYKNCQLIGDMELILLNNMHHAIDAGHRSGNRQGCLRGTRIDILCQLEDWLEDKQSQRVFWLNGLAGTGKSTIAQTFAEVAFAEGNLGASFFCSRGFEDRSNIQTIFPTLAFQLAHQYPMFRQQLLRVLRANSEIGQESLCSQFENLIVGPFKTTQISTLIVIDALDECKDNEPASAILSVLSRYVDEIPNVKFFITGRPEPRIHTGFRLKSLQPITEVLKLHEVERLSVDSDIRLFFRTRLADITKTRRDCNFPQDWPDPSDLEILCQKAAGFFIYASTAVKFIASKSRTPTEQLSLAISIPQHTTQEGRGIDPLYTQVLEQAVDDVDMDDEDREGIHTYFRTVVGTVLLVFNPLSARALSELLKVSNIPTILYPLHSLLLVPEKAEVPIQAFHKSFPDFLTDPKRCKGKWFFVNPEVHHAKILLSCLKLMRERLRRNICKLDDYITLSEITDLVAYKKGNIGEILEYACQFWSKHLLEIPKNSTFIGEVEKELNKFFATSLLPWVEVLVLGRNLGAGVYAMNDVEQWCTLVGVSCKWTNDIQRCLLEYFDVIQDSPFQIYTSTFSFCPLSSWLHESDNMKSSMKVRVVKGLPTHWGECSRTVSFDVELLDISHWNTLTAVGLGSGDINILDIVTGDCIAVLSGHRKLVECIEFSPDGALVASGSADMSAKLWDVQTGGIVRTLFGHTDWVRSISFSADSRVIASGSDDETFRLWNTHTGECHHIIEQKAWVHHVWFSPTEPQCFMSSTGGGKVTDWDMSNQTVKQSYDGNYIAFSPDGTLFAICKDEGLVVQKLESGVTVAEFNVANGHIGSCCFSPDSKLLAGAVDKITYVWDVASADPHLTEKFIGHTDKIIALAFSSPSCLMSASDDNSIKFWQIGTLSTELVENNPASTSSPLAQSKSITLQAKAGITITSDKDGVVRIWDILTGLCKTSFQTPAAGADCSDCQLIDGKLIIAWYAEKKIHVWDVEGQELLLEADGPKDAVYRLRISGEGSRIFCMDLYFLQSYSTLTGEMLGRVKFKDLPGDITWIIDGPRVWLYSTGKGYQGWNFGILGVPPIKLINPPPNKLHPNNTMLWDPIQFRVKDVATGRTILQLPRRFGRPIDVQWSDQYLVICLVSGEVLVLDFGQ